MANNKTILQRLSNVIQGVNGGNTTNMNKIVNYNLSPTSSNNVLYSFNTQEERDTKLKQLKQEKLLAYQWKKIARDSMMTTAVGLNQVKVMYRDADLMDQFPEINSGLHIMAEEATSIDIHGKMLHVYSTSARIKSILEDLFENRLNINVELPMVTRATCKYGNEFMFLNIDPKEGVLGWRELNVHQMNRVEYGAVCSYGGSNVNAPLSTNPNDVKFV